MEELNHSQTLMSNWDGIHHRAVLTFTRSIVNTSLKWINHLILKGVSMMEILLNSYKIIPNLMRKGLNITDEDNYNNGQHISI